MTKNDIGKPRIVAVPTMQLKPNAYNPNRQSDEAFELLLTSIKEDGFTMPVIVNDGSKDPKLHNMIIDGEHRWRAALVLGLREVPVLYLPLTEAEMKASTIRHNRATGHHDAVLDAAVLKQIMDAGASVEEVKSALGMDEVEIDLALQALTSLEGEEVEDLDRLVAEEEEKFEFVEDSEAREMLARRRAMARRDDAEREEKKETFRSERLGVARIDMVFSQDQVEVVKKVIDAFGSFEDALIGIMEWAKKAGVV